MSVAYSNSRVQFGRPIGQFQRVQDHIIEMVNHLDAARWTTYEALSKLDKGEAARSSVHLAKAVTAEAHWEACNLAHEVHAGLGSDTQFGLAKHTYVSRSLYAFLGDPRWHRQELARVLRW
jgi:alkylation response protein AidB-like acyl-CoA dehydrogenase